jgi:FlaA1/EpsC-like NDP-sugar epimerase
MYLYIAEMPRKYKILIMLLSDVLLLPLALWTALALRFGTFKPVIGNYWWLFFVIPFITVPIFIRLGLYRAVIRFVDEQILKTVIYGVSLSTLLLTAIITMTQIQVLPRSSIIIYWFMASGYIFASRYFARGVLRTLERKDRRKQNVAIYGAGRAGLQTALALFSSPEYRPILFFDDNKELEGTTIAGIRVYHPENAIDIMNKYACHQLLLALPSATRIQRKMIIQKFEKKNIHLMTLPGMGELITGKVKVEDIRDVGVEDLLGRDPVPPFEDLISSCIENKVVMVTGAGGSIGSEVSRQILKNNPQKIILFERSEYLLYKIEKELANHYRGAVLIPILGDVINQYQLEKVISSYKVETIYHAAAYKHVPLVETNVVAGVMNNVFGTFAVAQAAILYNVSTFVLISTDKAVRPTNVMGATKRLAELVIQALASKKSSTRFCMVRFGNVLGSSGSVVPLFKEQIRQGGPVTVTHPEVTRYFMTMPEASQLVLQAGALGEGGDVFVLDMGDPVKIVDLARNLIELSGFEVKTPANDKGDIEIEFVGLRPGEKLYEELLIGNNVTKTKHPRIMKANEEFISYDKLMLELEKLKQYCEKQADTAVVQILKEIVKEFKQTNET